MAVDTRFGRLGLEIDWDAPQRLTQNVRPGEWIDDVTGRFRGATLADTLALAAEFKAQAEIQEPLPLVSTTYPDINGFYLIQDVDVSADYRNAALIAPGWIDFRLRAKREGSYSQTKLQSVLAMVSAVEDFSTTPDYTFAPPIDAKAFDAGASAPTLITRKSEDGDHEQVATGMTVGTSPTWSVDPASYYGGAVKIWAGDVLRAGLDMPMDPTDWMIGNGMVQVRPSTFQGTSDGGLQFQFHDGGGWGDWVNFQINHAGTNTIPAWEFVTIMGNTASQGRIRIQYSANETPTSTTSLHELDIKVRRGSPIVTMLYKYTGAAATHAVELNETGTATRPGGTASYAYWDTLDSVGNRIVFGCPKAFTLSGLEIQLNSTSQHMPFWVAAAIDAAANGTGNGPADLAEQYVGQVAETVKAARR